MTRILIGICTLALCSTANAKDIEEIEIGAIYCYNRLGPVDTIGVAVAKNFASNQVQLQMENGNRKFFDADKITSTTYCDISSAAQKKAWEYLSDVMQDSNTEE